MNPGTVLLLLAGAYLLYQYSQPPTAPAPPAPGTPPPLKTNGGPAVPSGAPGTTVVGAPAQPLALPVEALRSTLANTYARFTANVNANRSDPAITTPNSVLTASFDVWNYYLAQVTGISLPSSAQVNPSWSGITQLGIDAYWSGMARWLSTNAGMSGMGRRDMRYVPAFMSGGWR